VRQNNSFYQTVDSLPLHHSSCLARDAQISKANALARVIYLKISSRLRKFRATCERSHLSFDSVPSICVPRCNLTVYRSRFAAYTREGESIKLRSSSRSRDRGAKKNVENNINGEWAYDLRGERVRSRRETFAKQSVKRADLQDIIPKSGSR